MNVSSERAPLQRRGAAVRLAEEIGLPGEVWLIQAALGELYLKQDETGQAMRAFGQAAAIVRKLAETLGDEERRVTFLASPLVQQVLEQGPPDHIG